MFALKRCAQFLTCVAAFGMVASPVLGVAPIGVAKQKQNTVFDVKLSNGHLIGQVLDAAGKAEAGADVALISKQAAVGAVKTDTQGRFAFPIQKTGVYRVAVADRSFTIRAWRPQMAPPNAKTGLLCVTSQVVRGQCGGCGSLGACAPGCGMAAPACGIAGPTCGSPGYVGGAGGGGLRSILTNPVVIGLGIAAAIAIPIALDDDDDDDDNGGAGTGGSGEPAS